MKYKVDRNEMRDGIAELEKDAANFQGNEISDVAGRIGIKILSAFFTALGDEVERGTPPSDVAQSAGSFVAALISVVAVNCTGADKARSRNLANAIAASVLLRSDEAVDTALDNTSTVTVNVAAGEA